MNQSEMEAVIAEYARPFADRRLHIFEIETPNLQGNLLRLRGRVLEPAQRAGLVSALEQRFAGLRVEAGDVAVGRQDPPRLRWVGTNLTSLHDGTSFLNEMVSQMLNGAQVEVLWEDQRWGFVRQSVDGYLGWTYLPYLTDRSAPKPTALVSAPLALLHEAPAALSGLVTRILGGTTLAVTETIGEWAHVTLAGGWKGWLLASDLRGLDHLPNTADGRRSQMVTDGYRMIGVPYLWGGCSAHGIDCSGFAQLLHRWSGITIPRDADMQCDAGQPVAPPFAPGDLLFFGEQGEQRRITHVGVSLGGWRIIHSSRSRNGVQVDDVQAVEHLRESFLCAATYLSR